MNVFDELAAFNFVPTSLSILYYVGFEQVARVLVFKYDHGNGAVRFAEHPERDYFEHGVLLFRVYHFAGLVVH